MKTQEAKKEVLYIRLQQQRGIFYKELKVPSAVNQFTQALDWQTATQLLKLAHKYRLETKEKQRRLLACVERKAAGKGDIRTKRLPVLGAGVNTVTTLVETKKAQLVVIVDDGVHECAPKDMKEPYRESRISADMVERLVNHLVPSLQGDGDPFYVPAFLYSYRRFTTTQHVLDLLFKRYAYFRPDCREDEQVKSILYSFLDMWIDKYPEEFCKISDLSILKKLQTYLMVNMPYSDLNLRVHMLLMELQQESSDSEKADEDYSVVGGTRMKIKLHICYVCRSPVFAPQEEKVMINEQLPFGNMESLRTERQQYPQKLDVTLNGICPWIETEAKTWNELRESLAMLKSAKKMRCRIQRIELENSNLVVTIEKQAREMEALGEKLLHAGVNVAEAAPAEGPGETRETVAASWSQVELMELTSELAQVRMQEDSYKMEVQKYKELYLKELRSNNALLSSLQNRTCKCSERSCSNYEEEMRWKTSSMVALVGPHPEGPQVPYLTSSTMGPQGSAPQPSQGPEARCEFMEKSRHWSEDKEKARLELISSVRSLLCALHQETRRTKGLKKELAEMKKIFSVPPQEKRAHEGRRHHRCEVSKVSQADTGVPVAMLRLEGEATTAENLGSVRETSSASVLTQMELKMKSIRSAIAEVSTQECLVKKELDVIKQLYRGELEHLDSMSLGQNA
ncbi:uncharacterized protein LOC127664580 [Apodemus sylvaticus]|uniref:uncharacterized protein LOC127664580 n=1 Tax=Apodemus sylvaticus TaxID=10129 RepID=UPI00224451F4|nr:uncharacterized protein LOC127664580 [Apodemus sylvaticus]